MAARRVVAVFAAVLVLAACRPEHLWPMLDDGLHGSPPPSQHVATVAVGPGTSYPLTHSWRSGCPVGPADLVGVEFDHHRPDGGTARGVFIVHRDQEQAIRGVVRALWVHRFALTSARPIDDFGGVDAVSVAADNSSAFNCRAVAGSTRWSQHAYGRAIDLNPAVNPHLSTPPDTTGVTGVLGHRYPRPGVLHQGHPVVRAFDLIGWGWGGRWSRSKDYQHFSASGT